MKRYGLALSGGGVRGAAHVGVLKALAEEDLLPDQVAGTSAGSIVAGLYASGLEIPEMEAAVLYLAQKGLEYLDPDYGAVLGLIPQLLTGASLSLSGLIKGDRLFHYLEDLTDHKQLSDAVTGLVIPAVDLNSGDTIVYTNLPYTRRPDHICWETEGSLAGIMMASASVPAVFAPRRMGDYLLVDGGVTDNLPGNLLNAAGERRVIAVDIGSDYQRPQDHSIVEVISRSFSIMSGRLKECGSTDEIILLKPELSGKAGLLTFSQMTGCMEEGYRYTKKMLPEIHRRLRISY